MRLPFRLRWLALVPVALFLGAAVAAGVNALGQVDAVSIPSTGGATYATLTPARAPAPLVLSGGAGATSRSAVPRTVTVTPRTPAPSPPVVIVLPRPTTPPPTSTPPPSASTPSPTPSTTPTKPPAPEPYYANCDAVRAAGKAPLHRGEPGYRAGLDHDSDGTACDVTT